MNQTNRTLTFRQGANVLGALSLAIGLLFLLGEMLNLRLSADRAGTFAKFAAGQGIDPDKLTVIASGDREPVASNETAADGS